MNKHDLPKNAKPLIFSTDGKIVIDGIRFRYARKGEKAFYYKQIEPKEKSEKQSKEEREA